MNTNEAMEYIQNVSKYGSKLGLDSIKELLNRLGNPQNKLRVIHIAGTNGKGSILSYLQSIVMKSGYRAGRYVSPTVFDYFERFQINGTYMQKNEFSQYVTNVKTVIEEMVKDGFSHPTVFEVETAISFLYFCDQKADLVLLETGLGGRWDATNVVDHPICVIIASISMDHMQFLGTSIEEIAREKAGIIKENCHVVLYPNDDKVTEVIEEECTAKSAVLHYVKEESILIKENSLAGQKFAYDRFRSLFIPLLGEHQVYNAATAVEALNAIRERFCLSDFCVEEGLKETKWPARFEIAAVDPVVVRDGAHNEEAAIKLKNALEYYFTNKRFIYIIGVLADKEYEKIVKRTADLASVIITITPDNERALAKEVLALEAMKYCNHVLMADDVKDALNKAREIADTNNDIIIAFGSLSFLDQVR